MPSRRKDAGRFAVEPLEGRSLLTVVFMSSESVVPTGSRTAMVEIGRTSTGPPEGAFREEIVEIDVYAPGANPEVDPPVTRNPAMLSIMTAIASFPVSIPEGAQGTLPMKLVVTRTPIPNTPMDPGLDLHQEDNATLKVVDRADVTPPTLVSVRELTRGKNVEAIEVKFSEPMARAAAEDPANYAVAPVFKRTERHGQKTWAMVPPMLGNPYTNLVTMARAEYDPATQTVRLTPSTPYRSSGGNVLVDPRAWADSGPLTNSHPSPLTDEAGNQLDGDDSGLPDGRLPSKMMSYYGPSKSLGRATPAAPARMHGPLGLRPALHRRGF